MNTNGSASVRTWRQDVTGEAEAAVGRATAGVLGPRDAVTAGLFREPGADIVVTDLADLLGGQAAP